MSLLGPLLIDIPAAGHTPCRWQAFGPLPTDCFNEINAIADRRSGFIYVDVAYATGIFLRVISLRSVVDASMSIRKPIGVFADRLQPGGA